MSLKKKNLWFLGPFRSFHNMSLKKNFNIWFLGLLNRFVRLAWPCLILLVSMVIFVDQITVYFLFGFSIYFLYKRKYKDLLFIWVFFFISWYFIFTALFFGFESKMLFGDLKGKESTWDLLAYTDFMYSQYPSLREFCIVSVGILHFLGLKLGVTIYIPSLFKGVLFLIKFILGRGFGGTPV